MDNVRVRLVSLPMTVKGVTIEDFEGNYIVFINDNYSEIVRWKTLRHEIEHIRKHHLDSQTTYVTECESIAKMTEAKIKKAPMLREESL